MTDPHNSDVRNIWESHETPHQGSQRCSHALPTWAFSLGNVGFLEHFS